MASKAIVPVLIGLAIGAAAFLPARLLLPSPPLSAANVAGSVWHASLTDAAVGSVGLGQVDLIVEPAALLRGRLQWRIAGNIPGGIAGQIWQSPTGGGSEAISGTISGAALPGLPLAAISLADAAVTLDIAGRCRSASGQISTGLAAALAGQSSLSGALRCDGSVLLLPMASPDGRVRLDVRIMARGWQAELAVAGAAPAETLALAAAGFGRRGSDVLLIREGRW
ncbi:type II secretion system protein N [Sandarakinorhabdus sp.]|uniref:type II secretion system protein N n=1 Tax=Sandarakinorhabdus sp. TaxID=1916663 RepID=UPI0033400D5B